MNTLTPRQAAQELGISHRRVLALIASGRLAAERLSTPAGEVWQITPQALELVRERPNGRPRGTNYRPRKRPAQNTAAPGTGAHKQEKVVST